MPRSKGFLLLPSFPVFRNPIFNVYRPLMDRIFRYWLLEFDFWTRFHKTVLFDQLGCLVVTHKNKNNAYSGVGHRKTCRSTDSESTRGDMKNLFICFCRFLLFWFLFFLFGLPDQTEKLHIVNNNFARVFTLIAEKKRRRIAKIKQSVFI